MTAEELNSLNLEGFMITIGLDAGLFIDEADHSPRTANLQDLEINTTQFGTNSSKLTAIELEEEYRPNHHSLQITTNKNDESLQIQDGFLSGYTKIINNFCFGQSQH